MHTAVIIAAAWIGAAILLGILLGRFIHVGSWVPPPAPPALKQWQCNGCQRTYTYPDRPEYFDFEGGTYRAWCCRNCVLQPAKP